MQDRFQHLLAVISGQRFLNKQGLGNEVPFFICPFKPEESLEMERLQRQLVNRLEQAGVIDFVPPSGVAVVSGSGAGFGVGAGCAQAVIFDS